jgi:hypothetical protein
MKIVFRMYYFSFRYGRIVKNRDVPRVGQQSAGVCRDVFSVWFNASKHYRSQDSPIALHHTDKSGEDPLARHITIAAHIAGRLILLAMACLMETEQDEKHMSGRITAKISQESEQEKLLNFPKAWFKLSVSQCDSLNRQRNATRWSRRRLPALSFRRSVDFVPSLHYRNSSTVGIHSRFR